MTGIADSMKNHLLKCPSIGKEEKDHISQLIDAPQQTAARDTRSQIPIQYYLDASGQRQELCAVAVSGNKRLASQPLDTKKKRSRLDRSSAAPDSELEKHILKATVSANLPFSWVENNEVKRLLCRLQPGLQLPTKNALEHRILKDMNNDFASKSDTLIRASRYFTVSLELCENQFLVTSLVTAEKRLVPAVDVSILGNPNCIAEKLQTILGTRHELDGSKCVAVTTGCSSQLRVARQIALRDRPDIVGLDCAALHLMLADLVRSVSWVDNTIADVVEMIGFWKYNVVAQSRLRQKQELHYGHPVELIAPQMIKK